MGSKQWIGAIELGFILDTLLGVSSKVITVSSGADMPSKAREIAHHFDTQVRWPLRENGQSRPAQCSVQGIITQHMALQQAVARILAWEEEIVCGCVL